jgi:DNA replication licensing factor MCM5
LAAANPIFGRYDDLKTTEEQIDFQTTILSRFDMIFLVKDQKDSKKDERLARHLIDVHINRKVKVTEGDIQLEKLKRYIAYCRSSVSPRLNKVASELLINYYVDQRSKQKKNDTGAQVYFF